MKLTRHSLAILFVLLCASPALGVVREVGPGQTHTTIGACITAASNGDTCNVHAATYTESPTVNKSITIQANTGDVPILSGKFTISANNVTIDGFEIIGYTNGAIVQDTGAEATGLTVTATGGRTCKIHGGSGPGLYARLAAKLILRNCEIYGNTTAAIDGNGITTISGHSTDGTYANGVLIENNNIHDNGVDCMQVHSQYHIIQGNTCFDNITTAWASNHPDGLQLNAGTADGYTSTNHMKVLGNVFRNHTQGIFVEGSVSGESSDAADTLIANNVIYQTSGTVNGVNMASLSINAIVLKFVNVVYAYGNTVGDVRSNCFLVQDSKNGTVHIKNNICEQTSGTGYDIEQTADVASGEFNYNQCKVSSSCVIWGGTGYATLTAFNTAVPTQMANRVDASATLNAFPTPTLIAGSPAIDVGVDLSGSCADCTTDKNGNTRPYGAAWDLGAYEFGAGKPSVVRGRPVPR